MCSINLSLASPDLYLLLLVCRADHVADDEVRSWLKRGVDWSGFLQAVRVHELMPLVCRRLKECGAEEILPEQISALRLEARRLLRENAAQFAFFLYCHGLLSRWGIPCIPFKGPVLAWQAYGDEMLRVFTDVDFLIQAQDFPQVYDLLLQEGFKPEFDLDRRQMRLLLKGDTEFRFRRGGYFLELHWLVSEREDLFPIPEGFFWDHSAVVPAFGREMRLLSPECTFFLSCLHGSKHLWSSLKWAVDLAFLSHHIDSAGWSALQAWGREWGFLRCILLGAVLANKLGGVALPDLAELSKPNSISQYRINQVFNSWLHAPAEHSYWSVVRFYMNSRERLRDRIQYLVRKAFAYKKEDWLSLPLPELCEFLYFLFRPVRIAFLFGIPFLTQWFRSLLRLRH